MDDRTHNNPVDHNQDYSNQDFGNGDFHNQEMPDHMKENSMVSNANKQDEPQDLREIPNSVETEQHLLGAIIVNNDVYHKVADILEPLHFYEGLHERIYAKIAELLNKNMKITPSTLKVFFEADEIMQEIGGTQYLTKLAIETMGGYNAVSFAKTIIDCAKRRDLIEISHRLENDAYDMNCDDDFADLAEVAINSLSQSGDEKAVFNIGDAAIELMRRAEETLKSGKKIGLEYPLPSLNSLLGNMMPGDLIILGGATSAGKTSLSQKIALHVAQQNPVMVFSLEMPAPEFTNRYVAQISKISTEKIETGDLTNEEFDQVYEVAKSLENNKMVIDGTGKLKVSQMRARAKKMQREGGLSFILVDHLGFIEFEDRRTNKIDGLGEVTRDLKAMAKELHVPILCLSHLNRGANARDNKRPMLTDLHGSSSIEKDADIVFFVHREEYWLERAEPVDGTQEYSDWTQKLMEAKGKAEIIIAKGRRRKGTGYRTLEFEEKYTNFHELSIEPNNQNYYSAEGMR